MSYQGATTLLVLVLLLFHYYEQVKLYLSLSLLAVPDNECLNLVRNMRKCNKWQKTINGDYFSIHSMELFFNKFTISRFFLEIYDRPY